MEDAESYSSSTCKEYCVASQRSYGLIIVKAKGKQMSGDKLVETKAWTRKQVKRRSMLNPVPAKGPIVFCEYISSASSWFHQPC